MVSGLVLAIALFALVAATTIQIRSTSSDGDHSGYDQPRRTPPDPRATHGVTGALRPIGLR